MCAVHANCDEDSQVEAIKRDLAPETNYPTLRLLTTNSKPATLAAVTYHAVPSTLPYSNRSSHPISIAPSLMIVMIT